MTFFEEMVKNQIKLFLLEYLTETGISKKKLKEIIEKIFEELDTLERTIQREALLSMSTPLSELGKLESEGGVSWREVGKLLKEYGINEERSH